MVHAEGAEQCHQSKKNDVTGIGQLLCFFLILLYKDQKSVHLVYKQQFPVASLFILLCFRCCALSVWTIASLLLSAMNAVFVSKLGVSGL